MSTNPPSVTRTQADRYDVRSDKAGEWATFIVCSDGQLLVQSAYGNWAYFWPCHGCRSFKHFLVEIDTDYLINKFGGTRTDFDGEKTIEAMKAEIIQQRDGGMLDDEAKMEPDDFADGKVLAESALKELDQDGFSSPDDVYTRVYEDTIALPLVFPDYSELPLVYVDNAQLTAFTQKLWPLFVAELKKELHDESPKDHPVGG